MIGRIAGIVEHRGPDHVLIDVRGVGYIVHVSDRTLAALPPVGEPAALYTELLVREDLLQLVGFPTLLEKEWHRLLTTVQGVGSRAAMAILSALGPDGTARAIALGDARALQSAPGIGPKIASRVALELKAKAPALMAMAGTAASRPAEAPSIETVIDAAPAAPKPRAPAPPLEPAASAEALSALINLGYTHGDAAAAIARTGADIPDANTPTLIRAALKFLAPRQ